MISDLGEGGDGRSLLSKAILVVLEVCGGINVLQYAFFKYLGRGGQEGDLPIRCSVVHGLASFQKGDDIPRLPVAWYDGGVNGEVYELREVGDAEGAKMFYHYEGGSVVTDSLGALALLDGFLDFGG